MSLDVYIYNSVISLTAGSAIWQLLSVLAASGLIWFLVIWYIFSVLGRKKTGPVEFFALILGGSMVYLFNIGVSIWWWRPRPFVLLDMTPLINVNAASKSFPSDHAALAFFIAFLLSQYQKKWWWAYLVALLVALGRVAVGVHYPADILAGMAVGLAFGYLTIQTEKLFSHQSKT